MPPDDPLFERLRSLPEVPLEGQVGARVLRQARAVLVDAAASQAMQGRQQRAPWRATLETVWSHAVAPSIVTLTVAAYLFWAVRAASGLYR